MIFRRQRDEMEGFRRMREALRQQADPQDHALLDDQYGDYDEDDAELAAADGAEVADEALTEAEAAEYGAYAEASSDNPNAAGLVAADETTLTPTAGFVETFPGRHPVGSAMTTIAADTSWSGTLRSEGNVYIEGRIEGTLEVHDTIFIAERATLDATVKAHSVVIAGQVSGRVECDGRLEVTPTGRLNAEVEAGSLIVHEGAVLDGKFKMKPNAG